MQQALLQAFLLFAMLFPAAALSASSTAEQIVETVNAKANGTWRAEFNGLDLDRVRKLLGVRGSLKALNGPIEYAPKRASSIGDTFDAREKWPGCVGPIVDQGVCGSCWAVAAADAMSDRLCVSSRGSNASATYVALSAMDLTSCDFEGENMGCLGGVPMAAWQWAKAHGLVTAECLPYLKQDGGYIDTCQPQPNCTLDQHDATPYCTSTCAPRSARQYDDDKHRLRSVYAVGSSDIEDALSADGPVEATLSVFADFTYYKEGVYTHVAGDFMGKHAVRIVGWGTDPTAGAYWLVANSWSTAWGDRGYFKIARGTNECGFESEVVAGEF